MRSRLRRLGSLCVALACIAASIPAVAQDAEYATLDRTATDAYRAGRYPAAVALWSDVLATADLPPAERGRLLFNLGNASYRDGDLLRAVGYYTAALRYSPRDADAWSNLELARAEAELEPADRGDLGDTVWRMVSSLTPAEASWLALLGLLPLALALVGEALRGGRVWRRLAWMAVLVALVAATPWMWHESQEDREPMLVVQSGGAQGRSEPRADAKRLGRLEAGAVVEQRDALPGWVKVESGGREQWVRDTSVFDLRL